MSRSNRSKKKSKYIKDQNPQNDLAVPLNVMNSNGDDNEVIEPRGEDEIKTSSASAHEAALPARRTYSASASDHDRQKATRVVHANASHENASFPDNRVKNTKYTLFNFIPKQLYEQFSLHINRYFLLIAILQLFPVLTPVNPITTWGPLIVIFTITAVKEAVDDRRRAREDKKANERMFTVFKDGVKCEVMAKDINVGDIVYLVDDDEVPADLFLLQASSKSGSIFIQTANLDGETSLKQRVVVPDLRDLSEEDVGRFRCVIECATPNAAVYNFDSRLWIGDSANVTLETPTSISGDQLLQQTTRVANTDWVYGVVVYTGNETKFGKNRGHPPFKYTKVDHLINRVAVIIFLFQLLLVFIFGVYGDVWRYGPAKDHFYLDYGDGDWYDSLIIPLRFLLLNSTMIPISLKVTLDLCKLLYAKFIIDDLEMYDPVSDKTCVPKNTSISEDLGQVEYILADKTGTLTQNIMEFKKCSIGENLFDEDDNLGFTHHELAGRVQSGSSSELEMMKHFALNSSVVPVRKGDSLQYRASSPDEVALVKAAARMGVGLVHRDGPNVTITVNGKEEEYEVLGELAFTSDRKRMSVAILDKQTKKIRLYVKGADDVILARMAKGQDPKIVMRHLEAFAAQGLRTLFFAYRDLDEGELAEWQKLHQKANASISRRAEKLQDVYDLLEKDFVVQGCSAIEDKLQEGVPETISLLRQAGIRMWMLTGDKFSTALQIATSCNLKSASSRTLLCAIRGRNKAEIGECLDGFLRQAKATKNEVVVIVRGTHLEIALANHKEAFASLALTAHTVICCRVTPSQKADLVHLVREHGKQTLAIGDGGNDVSMIQQAHVGVGIRGKEGLQAARAADYAVSYFRDLKPLCLVHGRYSYLRTSLVAQYSYYKSFLFCAIQIMYGAMTAFSGATLFNSLCITAYNAVLFVSIVSFVFDKDVSFTTVARHPELYRPCQKSEIFNLRTMGWWNFRGLLQALVIFILTVYTRGPEYHNANNGSASDWETLGIVAFGAYLWVQSFTMCLELKYITYWNLAAIWGMHNVTILILLFTNALLVFDSLNGYWIVFVTFADPQFWLSNIVMLALCIVPVVAFQYNNFTYHPTMSDQYRYLELRQRDGDVVSTD